MHAALQERRMEIERNGSWGGIAMGTMHRMGVALAAIALLGIAACNGPKSKTSEVSTSGGVNLGCYASTDARALPGLLHSTECDGSGGSGSTPDSTPDPTPTSTPTPTPDPGNAPGDLRAFPGAEGGGALSLGGRGGQVILVTSLADSGSGSLRACMEASGARTCVFTVSGTINLSSSINVTNPYLTVAGQTAPGGGVQVVSAWSSDAVTFWIGTHDTIIRYVRVRSGGTPFAYQPGEGSGTAGAHNNVLDHISMQYCGNDCISVSQPPSRYIANGITFSWLLDAESAGPTTNRTAMVLSCGDPSLGAQVVDVDVHHNYMATHSHRMPKLGFGRMRVVNNIMFNSEFLWAQLEFSGQADLIGNIFKEGSRSNSEHPIHMFPSGGTMSAYVANNVSTRYLTSGGSGDVAEWNALVREMNAENGQDRGGGTIPNTSTYRRSSPHATRTRGLNITPLALTGSGSNLEALLLRDGPADGSGPVGASRRLDCQGNWVGSQDVLDARIVNYYSAGGSPLATHPNSSDLAAGTFYTIPTLAAGAACAGMQTRGMPDAWVDYWKTRVSPAASNLAPSGNQVPVHLGWPAGYTNLDVYLSGLAPAQ
ncbi:MAG: hypothetical protein A2V77_18300 [Anaeromyxobacter sp. RBG_16_69_14]|nr:MAG: hypothetical protein A2V77_18300 [Anaeromyxobacter sp. RBG_16_69_14]